MMFIIGSAFLVIACLFKKKCGAWFNPGSLFTVLWGTIFVLYSLHLFEIYTIETNTIIIFTMGISAFCLGFYPVKYLIGRVQLFKNYSEDENAFAFSIESRIVFSVLSFLTVIVLIVRATQILPYWLGGVASVKQANVEGFIKYPFIINVLYTFLAGPMETIAVFVAAVDFFFNRDKVAIMQTILAGIIVVLAYVCSGSKFLIVTLLLSFVLVYSIYRNSRKKNMMSMKHLALWKKGLITITTGVAIIFLIYLLNNKYGTWYKSLYFYLVGTVPCGNNALENLSGEVKFHGMISFNGFARAISQALSVVGIKVPYQNYMNEAYNVMQAYEHAIYIAPGVHYNAFISMFSYFYADGGIIAVILLSFILGRCSSNVYYRLKEEKSAISMMLYLYICYLILYSMVRMQLYLVTSAMTLIYILLLFRKRGYCANE